MPATTPQPPFTECPAIGDDTSCAILIQITDTANNIIGDPSQSAFDGSDDTLIGLSNSSSDTISSIQLSSDTDLFGFDGDGICSGDYGDWDGSARCPYGTTGYEGPGTSFSGITPDQSGGVVNFSPSLAPGQSAYFSLEEPLSATTVTAGGPTPGEQGGPVNLSENRTTCSVAQPVNCATGTFWHQFTDFSIPGRGVTLNYSRTYSSSQASVNGPLGYGWTDSYNMSLSADASGDVTISQEDGSTVTFEPNGAGGFTAAPRVLATLTENPDGSYTFVRNHSQVQYNFSAAGQLASEVDLNGYQTQLSYNASGQLVTVTDPAGRTLTFSYTGSHITKVTEPLGRSWSYTYDGSGNLASATDPAGRTWSFTYDPNHLLLTMTDPRGGVTTNVYNGSGQVTSQTDPDSNTTTWSYSGDPTSTAGGTTTMTDPLGNQTVYQYASMELTSVTHAASTADAATTSYTYDPATLGVTSVTDPNGDTTTSSYDSSGNLLSTTDPLGNTTSYDYNSFNEVQDKTSPLGETTSYSYDGSGNLLSVTDPNGNTTSYAYADAAHPGDVTSVTDPDGDITSYSYDADGDVASATVKPGPKNTDTTRYTYDADGERTCTASANATAAGVTCPAAGSPRVADTTSTTFNADGEVTSVTDPDGHTTSYAYDGDGNKAQVTDPAGHVTSYAYNGDSDQTKITRPDGSTVSSSYDADGNLLSQTSGGGHTTSYRYDQLNRVTSVTDPLGHTTSYGYDRDGNRTSLTDPSSRVTSYNYDADSEQTGITYSDGSTPNVSYSYDADGHRSGMTDATGTTSYSYDADGHLTDVTNGAGADVSYGYDPAGRLTSLTYPNGQTVSRAYNTAGWLHTVTDWLGNKTTFSYDADGNLTTEAYPNGVTAASSYDDADQMGAITDKLGASTLATFSYSRNSQGQVTSDAETGAVQNATTTYSYNQLSQLAGINSTTYSYDADGNPTELANGRTQVFDSADELTTAKAPAAAKAPATDQVVTAHETSKAAKVASPQFTTRTPGELVLAFISAAGPSGGGQSVTSVTGAGLTWSKVARADGKPGTAEIWQAYAPGQAAGATVTAQLAHGADASITVATFTGARLVAGAHASANGDTTSPSVSLTTTSADSLVWGVGADPTHALKRTPASGQTTVSQYLDTGAHATYWDQRTGTITASGTKVKLADTTTSKDLWNLAAVEITSASGTSTSYSYDPDGNRVKITPSTGPATTLTYDQANRLIGYDTTRYAYNGDGLRTSKTVNGNTTTFSYDQSGSLPVLITAGATDYIYGPGNQPIEQISGSTPTYLQADQQGSTRLLTNSTGAVVGTYTYNPYGLPNAHTGTSSTPLRYDGQYTDAETGLQYLQARYYDPATAEFISVDPAVTLTGAPYNYAGDDPVNAFDPTGLSWYNPLTWSSGTWAAVGFGVALVGVGVLTLGAGDVVIGAGVSVVSATTIETETLAATEISAESVSVEFSLSEAIGAAKLVTTVGGITRSAYETYSACKAGGSTTCTLDAGGLALDALTQSLIGQYITEELRREIAEGAADALSLGYDYFKDWLLSKLQSAPAC